MKVYLERVDPGAGLARFYIVIVLPILLGGWAVVREWGRIGQGGTVRDEAHVSADAARASADRLMRAEQRRGYWVKA